MRFQRAHARPVTEWHWGVSPRDARIARTQGGHVGKVAGLVQGHQPVRADAAEAARLGSGSTLIGVLGPLTNGEGVRAVAATGVTSFAMEAVPRIRRIRKIKTRTAK